jgi:hypothetical protein
LLATDDDLSLATFLAQLKGLLGLKTLSSVTLFWDDYTQSSGFDPKRWPNMIWKVLDVTPDVHAFENPISSDWVQHMKSVLLAYGQLNSSSGY